MINEGVKARLLNIGTCYIVGLTLQEIVSVAEEVGVDLSTARIGGDGFLYTEEAWRERQRQQQKPQR